MSEVQKKRADGHAEVIEAQKTQWTVQNFIYTFIPNIIRKQL